jgi:iron complex transport system ATP-binding protein
MHYKLENINFTYKNSERKTLIDINCSFEKRKFYGIYGPNGSGKSTLLKILSCEVKADSGKIILPFPKEKRAQHLALIEQNIPVNIPLSVKDTVALGKYPWRKEKYNEKNLQNALLAMDLIKLSERNYSTLSGGEKQRVMLARALTQNTEFLLLDEPGSSLDLKHQISLYKLLKNEAKNGRCIIMVSQDLFLATKYIDEIILMKEGKLLKKGKTQDILKQNTIEETFNCKVPFLGD